MGTTTESRISSTQAKDAIYKASQLKSSAGEIDLVVAKIVDKVDLAIGKNLFNQSDVDYLAEYFINHTNGATVSTVNFNATGFIPITAGTTYAFSVMSYLAWYDKNKVFISGLPSGQSTNYTTAPANAKYLRASIPVAQIVNFQIEEGTISTSYEKYKGKYNKATYAVTPEETSFFIKTRNLLNKSDMFASRYIVDSNGTLGNNDLFYATNYIPIVANTSYILSGVGTVGFSAWYDTDYKFISGVVNLRNGAVSPSNAKYLRTTSYANYINTAQLEVGTIASAYVPYQQINPLYVYERQYDLKIWSLLGDSITAQDSWQKVVASYFGFYYKNNAIGGTKISGTTNKSFVHDDRVNGIDINSDIITVLGGTNDFGLDVPIGTDTSVDITTFKGALNVLITKLCTRFPTKRIIFTTTPYGELTDYISRGWTNAYTNSNGNTPADFAEAVRVICKKNNIPYIDLSLDSGWNKTNLLSFTSDSIHPNILGQNRITNSYIKFMSHIGL